MNEQQNKTTVSDTGFDEFWKLYPRKVGKPAARRAWNGAVKKTSVGQIILGLRAYAFSPEPSYIPHPSTWLNQERWVPEEITAAPTLAAPPGRTSWRGRYDGGPGACAPSCPPPGPMIEHDR